MHGNMAKKNALKALVTLLAQRVIGLALYLFASGAFANPRGAVNFFLYFLVSFLAGIFMYHKHPDTLSERRKKRDNTMRWDKALLPLYVILAHYGIYIAAGIGIRFGWPALSIAWMFPGIALYLVSGAFIIWPVMVNPHFESTVRVQNDRAQTVISTGPYRIVRHPGYLGLILWAVSTILIFGTFAVGLIATAIVLILLIRTYLEDTLLIKELPGYLAYTKNVKYRLVPFVW